jgi:hypothetical protein
MSEDTTAQGDAALIEPTSEAATRETEPEIRAGILSGDIPPGVPSLITDGGSGGLPYGKLALLLAGSIALGYGASRYWRR